MTSWRGRTRSSIGRDSGWLVLGLGFEEEEGAAVVEVELEEAEAEVVELVSVEEKREEDDLATRERCSSSRSFWISFCSISERRRSFLPPKSAVRFCRFLCSSFFSRSISPIEPPPLLFLGSGRVCGERDDRIGDADRRRGYAVSDRNPLVIWVTGLVVQQPTFGPVYLVFNRDVIFALNGSVF